MRCVLHASASVTSIASVTPAENNLAALGLAACQPALAIDIAPVVQRCRQFRQIGEDRIRLGVCLLPRRSAGVEPDGAHAGLLCAADLVARVIPNMHGLLCGYSSKPECFLERARVGLADAQLFCTQGKAEIVGQAQAAYVGVAVGDYA